MPTSSGIALKYSALAGILLAAALQPHTARAALGEPEASVTADAQQFQGSIKSTQRANYQMHEIQLPSGTVLREFVDSAGTVFAVAWSGPAMPNLQQTLGRYFDNYAAAAKDNPNRRRHVQIRQSDLVVESAGHMRAFSGRAYLPQSIPAGTSLEDIR
jgi:Protein of unknown function (DUF2844)